MWNCGKVCGGVEMGHGDEKIPHIVGYFVGWLD